VLNPSTVALGDEVAVPAGAQVAFAGDTLAVLANGHVWMMAAEARTRRCFEIAVANPLMTPPDMHKQPDLHLGSRRTRR